MNKLYIITTPIGNLKDLTLRSVDILKGLDYLLCEDTKITGKIKNHLGLKAKMIPLHKFNEKSKIHEVLNLLEKNNVGLVSDAGTPTISDPGQILIKELKNKIDIVPLPGATAITTALSASGLEFKNFTFVGFLEKEKNKIIKTIEKHLNSDVIVAYESPNRINKTLEDIENYFGNIKISIARELTKIYEEILLDKISNLKNKKFKGEIVLMIETKDIVKEDTLEFYIKKLKLENMNNKSIIKFLNEAMGFKKNDIYNFLKNNYN